uniref:Uncharacterized protein n=1 Tax=Oryza barthii TaxID=65489 RepID=A0A0D3HTS3_9ORYZ
MIIATTEPGALAERRNLLLRCQGHPLAVIYCQTMDPGIAEYLSTAEATQCQAYVTERIKAAVKIHHSAITTATLIAIASIATTMTEVMTTGTEDEYPMT